MARPGEGGCGFVRHGSSPNGVVLRAARGWRRTSASCTRIAFCTVATTSLASPPEVTPRRSVTSTVPSSALAASLTRTGDLTLFLVLLLVTAFAVALVVRWRTRRFDASGEPHHRVLWGLAVAVVGLTFAYLVSGRPFTSSLPEVGSFGTTGGFRLSPEFAALLIALVLYTASHIAEIVRGSILSVQRGQSEAANALGLSGFQRLRHVVLPQAFRVSVPPLANQYLNLTKNSSLGIAIGYYELTRIARISISQAAPAPQATLVLMLFYLAF